MPVHVDNKLPEWMARARQETDQRLEQYFAAKLEQVEVVSSRSRELVDAVRDLTMRGGKRLRSVAARAGALAVGARPLPSNLPTLAAALELLQTYLLIHDDWMDRSNTRRGGPSVHELFRARYADSHLADSIALLAGDLAAGYSVELIGEACAVASTAGAKLMASFAAMQTRVYFGQHLDLVGDADIGKMHALKTASYTVVGPLELGAIAAEASEEVLDSLRRFGTEVGLAFQLRDDLIGVFGDASATGKPVGGDITEGKLTAVVAAGHSTMNQAQRAVLDRAFANPDASASEIDAAVGALVDAGARAVVEAEIARRRGEALAIANSAGMRSDHLIELVDVLTDRDV